jgi:DNA-binding MarR family transcriptional regulator
MKTWLQTYDIHQQVNKVIAEAVKPFDLTPIEAYILLALFAQDGQHATDLAQAVGRAATSFTPNLDNLCNGQWTRRAADTHDRRAVRLYLTNYAQDQRDALIEAIFEADLKASALVEQWAYKNAIVPLPAVAAP